MGDSISLNNYIEQLQAIQNSNTYEATAYTLPRNTDAVEIEVDSNNRTINIPKNFSNAIVYNDHNSLSLVFKIPRYFDDVDFSEKTCVIPYINPNGKQNIGVGVPISVTSDYITIEWNITNDCTCGVGVLTFAISFYSINDDGYIDYQWSTIPTALSVLRGLELIDGVFDVISSTMYEEILSRITAHENSHPIAHADGSITFEKLDITLQELINSKGSDVNDTEVVRIAKSVLMGREINNHVLLTKENAEDIFFMFIELDIDMADPMVGGTVEVYDHYLTINEDVKFIYDNQEYIIENNPRHRIGFGFDNIGNNVYLYFDSNDNKALFSFNSYPPNENAICIGTLQEAETQSGRTEDDIELELVFNSDVFISKADIDILERIDTLDDTIGKLENLETLDKISIVGAINEACDIANMQGKIPITPFEATSSLHDIPFAIYEDCNKGVILNSHQFNEYTVGNVYDSCFSYIVDVGYDYSPVSVIFAQDDEKYYAITFPDNNSVEWTGVIKTFSKSTGEELSAQKRNLYLERHFEAGERILVTYTPSIEVTTGGNKKIINRYTVYRKRLKDVRFRQYMVLDLDTFITPILGWVTSVYVYSEIRGLYIDIDIPTYPVFNGEYLVNSGDVDYALEKSKKQWLAIGDSITGFNEASWLDFMVDDTDADTENATYGINYINFVEAMTNLEACRTEYGNNYGYSAHTIASGNGCFPIYSRRNEWDNISTNIITFFAGTNDYYYGNEIGVLDDYINNTGLNTVYGALRQYVDYFKTKGIKNELEIILITPIQRFDSGHERNTPNSSGKLLVDYVDAIKEVGKYESLKVIDLYNNGGIGEHNYKDVLKSDYLHPNKRGYEIIANRIYEALNTTSTADSCSTKIQEAVSDINVLNESVGNLYELETKDKSSLVEAINEVNRIQSDKVVISILEATSYNFGFLNTHNTEIRLSEVSSISFTFGDGEYAEDYISGLSFESGETATSIDYTDSGILNWVGTDCTMSEGLSIFQPSANTHYDIVFYFNGRQFIGLVNGFVSSIEWQGSLASGNVVSE